MVVRPLYTMRASRFTFFILMLATIAFTGCATSKPVPDPLAGWSVADYLVPPGEVFVKDYQGYIANLSSEERKFVGSAQFFKDGTGQHAIRLEIPLHGTWWFHVLIYDKDNKRINTIKYSPGGYRS